MILLNVCSSGEVLFALLKTLSLLLTVIENNATRAREKNKNQNKKQTAFIKHMISNNPVLIGAGLLCTKKVKNFQISSEKSKKNFFLIFLGRKS